MLQDLQKQTDVIKLVTLNLSRAHQLATESCGLQLDGETVINNQYKYGETVVTHLKFIQYLLQDGALYLSFMRVKDIWDCLMQNEVNCDGDYEVCQKFFACCCSNSLLHFKKQHLKIYQFNGINYERVL